MIYFSIISGQYLPSSAGPPDRVTECPGIGAEVVCGSDSIIVVATIHYGTKFTTTCGLANTTEGCCSYDEADCMTTYSSTSQQEQCNGKSTCTFGDIVFATDTTSTCGGTDYPTLNHYLTMEYYCLLSK